MEQITSYEKMKGPLKDKSLTMKLARPYLNGHEKEPGAMHDTFSEDIL